jgi:hypothetical protein
VGSQGQNCSDFNPCTVDVCNPKKGCTNEPSKDTDGADCGLATACSGLGVCVGGECVDTGDPGCEDYNPCTDDECQEGVGCVHLDNSAPCNDGDPCTAKDSCGGGQCAGTGDGKGITINCNQKNSIDKDGKCCCFAKDPTGKYLSAQVLDLGELFQDEPIDCCLMPGFNVGCKDKAYFDVSIDGKSWTNLFTIPTKSSKLGSGAWAPYCKTLESAEGFQFVRGGNNNCYVDHFKCSLPCESAGCSTTAPEDCDDGNVCTIDSCNGDTGNCTHQPINSPTCLVLHYGKNLVSFSHLPEKPTLDAVFGQYLPLIQLIFTEAKMIRRLNGNLVGNLERLERDTGYWVNVKLPAGSTWLAIPLLGEATDPDLKYTLHSGVNMIGFAGPNVAPLPAAMAEADKDMYEGWIGEGVALFLLDGEWVGSLTKLMANKGYEVLVNQDKVVNLNCPDCDGADPYSYGCLDNYAVNYDAGADIDNNSCSYEVPTSWALPTFGSKGKLQAFVMVHKLGNQNAVGAFVNGKSRGFGYTHGEFTVVPVIDTAIDAPIALREYDAAIQKESTITLNAPLLMKLNGFFLVGCTDPGAANYSNLATISANICQ